MNIYNDSDVEPLPSTSGVKLFVGQIPREMDEDTLIPYFAEFGPIVELTVIRDRLSKIHKGCAFVTYLEIGSAHQAIEQLHDKIKLGHAINPLQVRIAECQVERENKLFIGMLPKTVTEEQLHDMFVRYGDLREVHIIRGPEGASKGCAFVKFVERDAAIVAIEEMNNKVPDGSTRPLVIKFADVKKHGKKVDSDEQYTPEPVHSNSSRSQPFWQPPVQPTSSPYYYHYNYAQGGGGGGVPLPQQVMQSYIPYGSHNLSADSSYMMMNPSPYSQSIPVTLSNEGVRDMNRNAQMPSANYNQRQNDYDRRFQPNFRQVTPVPQSNENQFESIDTLSASTSSQRLVSTEFDDSPQSPTRPPEGPAGANLFIYHLPRDLTDADLATLFAPFGNVISAKVFVDKKTSDSKGFGFVSFDSIESADASIAAMNGFQIGSKRLKVQHKKTGEDPQMSPIQQEMEGLALQPFPNLPATMLNQQGIGSYMPSQIMSPQNFVPVRPLIHPQVNAMQQLPAGYPYSFRPNPTTYVSNGRMPSEGNRNNGLAYPYSR